MTVALAPLPIEELRQPLLATLGKGNRVVLSAPTGSGKSTRLPGMLLDGLGWPGRILVLQPRRLAALMLARRVAEEREVELGQEVGCLTRFESFVSNATRICFITDAILLRMLLDDPALSGISAVVFDEFHERSLANDLGLALVRQLQEGKRPDLRLVVMSATLEAETVQAWLGGCPRLASDGRLHPVHVRHLAMPLQRPVWEKAAEIVASLVASEPVGDILVFMPGTSEIRRTVDACREKLGQEPVDLLSLYGELPPEEQKRVMRPAAPGRRRVIVATNIAETSLTIPGVRHVVDSGLARVNRYDPRRGFDTLNLEAISAASADQRAGRAGREAPGTCARLWTHAEHAHRPFSADPEILRVELAPTVLMLAAAGWPDPVQFPWFQAPPPSRLLAGRLLLEEMGAVAPLPGGISDFGRRMVRFSAHPRLAALLLDADRHGHFEDAALVAAWLEEQNPAQWCEAFARQNGPKTDAFGGLSGKAFTEALSDVLEALAALRHCAASGFSASACGIFGIAPAAAMRLKRSFETLCAQGRRLGLGRERRPADGIALLKDLLRGFPDRLARRCASGEYELAGGRRGHLAKGSLFTSPLILALDVQEIGGRGPGGQAQAQVTLGLLSEIRREWLEEEFPEAWEYTEELYWDEASEAVLRRTRSRCLGVLVEERIDPAPPGGAAASMLAERLADGKLRLPGWDDKVDHWIERTRWLAEAFPERKLLLYDETDIRLVYEEICASASRFKHIRDADCLAAVKNALSWEDRQFVEEQAPERIKLPSGRALRLSYVPGQPAKGRARIQDLYDLEKLPVVAGGRRKILLDILAPNQRTVQITDDLPRFWQEHYPRLKRELGPRYPKHQWR